MRKSDNRGLTLVELLITIAILAVLTAVSGISISLAFSRDAEKCAKSIDTSLENARMYAMSQTGAHTFTLDIPGKQVLIGDVSGTDEAQSFYSGQFGKSNKLQSNVEIKVDGYDGAETVAITFDKSTGRVKEIWIDGENKTDEEGTNVLKIGCQNPSGTKFAAVVLIKNTGKHYIEYE